MKWFEVPRICPYCGSEFFPKHHTQVNCGAKYCRRRHTYFVQTGRAERVRLDNMRRAHMPSHYGYCANPDCTHGGDRCFITARNLCTRCYLLWKAGKLVLVQERPTATCKNPGCGKTFQQRHGVAPSNYCCPQCKAEAKRLRDRQRYTASVTGEVYTGTPYQGDGPPWGLENDPWPTLHAVGAFGLPVPMSTSVQPWGM